LKALTCIETILKAKHVFISGDTGSGKTGFIARFAKKYLHIFIFINPQMERIVDDICEVVTEKPGEILEALDEGYSKIEYIPDENPAIALKQIAQIQRDLFRLAIDMNVKQGEIWMNVIIDESDLYSGKMVVGGLNTIAQRGRRHGIRGFFLTQRGQLISHTILNQSRPHVYFLQGVQEAPYFETYNIPIEEHKEHLEKPFCYVLWDGREMVECDKIK